MAAYDTRYPVVLQAVMNHAQRLQSFLEDREKRARLGDTGAMWLSGRAGEIQCVVALVAIDWHQQRLSTEAAASGLARYIKAIHDGLAMHMDVGLPSCCQGAPRRKPLAGPRLSGPP
jgi:hypothetical protein